MNDVHARYAPLIKKISEIYAGDANLREQLENITVFNEEWDSNRAGGHFWFHPSASRAPMPRETVDAEALDSDGALIQIILHFVGSGNDWGEWFRWDMGPVLQWPPQTIRSK
jgi:hypothetical protein